MKFTKYIFAAVLFTGLASGVSSAGDKGNAKKAKPYPLATCVVSDEKLAGSEMKPYEFVHEGQTIKLCCKSCLKDFNKDTAKYLKKIEEETKKQKK